MSTSFSVKGRLCGHSLKFKKREKCRESHQNDLSWEKFRLSEKHTKFEKIFLMVWKFTRDHPFKTSPLFRGGGVKNLPNLPTESRGQKS